MSQQSVLFRVDSGVPIGSGHVMRCLNLAQQLKARGYESYFACRELDRNLIDLVKEAGHEVFRLPPPAVEPDPSDSRTWLGTTQVEDANAVMALLAGARFDWLIVDHYAISSEWERLMRRVADRLLVIDDLADREHDADVLVDQNYFGNDVDQRYAALLPPACRVLQGPHYALVQSIYARMRDAMPVRGAYQKRVFVFFGANDLGGSTLKVIKALSRPEFQHIAVDVVADPTPELLAALNAGGERFTLQPRLGSLIALMLRADVSIGAGGVTNWERASLALPSIVAAIAENQVDISHALGRDGYIEYVGWADDLSESDWLDRIRASLADAQRLQALGINSSRLVDGHGCKRVAVVIAGHRDAVISVRHVRAGDEWLLFNWANDREVRQNAFSKTTITADGHRRWFATRLSDSRCTMLIGEDQYGMPVGQVRFDLDEATHEATIDISIEPSARGAGMGSRLLAAAIDYWRARRDQYTLIAEVVEANIASQRMFTSAGFKPIPSRTKNSVAFELR